MRQRTSFPRKGLILLGVASVFLASPLMLRPLTFQESGWGGFANSTVAVERPHESVDLNADDPLECVDLIQGRVSIYACDDPQGKPLWQSPVEWQVYQWVISDLNHDGASELTLLIWRKFAPWPVDRILPEGGGRINSFHDAEGNSCHVILIGWKDGRFTELWAGSALYEPALSLVAVDLDADGAQELITIEGKYQDSTLWRSGPLAIWKWNGFGFDLVERFGGNFRHVIASQEHPGWVIVSQ